MPSLAAMQRPVAAGAYVMTLRLERGMTNRSDVAAAIQKRFRVKVGRSQIGKIEEGEIDTRGRMWAMVCVIVGGDAGDLMDLLAHPELAREEGVRRAKAWLKAEEQEAVRELRDKLGPERVRRALDDMEDDATLHLFRPKRA